LANVRLREFSQDLKGLFSGNLHLTGSLSALNPAGVRAEGLVRFSEGLSLLNRPLTAAILWNGDRLLLQQATAPGFRANGYILAHLQGAGAPAIAGLNLNVNLQNYDLAAVPVSLPPQAQIRGTADFNGQITGTPTAPTVLGQLALNHLVVNRQAFDPVMRGDVRYAAGGGLNLNLAGPQDRVAVQLDRRNRPLSFLVRVNDSLAQGNAHGDRLLATLQNFPLDWLNLAPAANLGLGAITGQVNGTFEANLANLRNPTVVGDVAIARPGIGYIQADQFEGQFRYSDGVAVLDRGNLRRNDSLYQITGTFSQRTSQFKGAIAIDHSNVQDILTALQWFDFQDLRRGVGTPHYAAADTVHSFPILTSGYSLLDQLRRYSEISALLDQQAVRRAAHPSLPALANLAGNFSGNIQFAGSPQTGINANFDLEGQNWTWEKYGVNQVVAQGTLKDGVITLLPFRLQGITYASAPRQEVAFVSLTGQIGGAQQSAQLRVENIPVEGLRDLVNLPISLTGDLNTTATLAGSQRNPQAVGEVNLVGARLNGNQVQGANVLFNYNNARLTFNGKVVLDDPEPLRASGSIPYRFDFMDPALDPGDQVQLSLNVRNEGLALINLLSRNQLAWQGGEGDVRLDVTGTLSAPLATGTAVFNGAEFKAQALPEPLTGVTGRVLFNRDRIQVETLQGQFSSGQVVAQGILPIFTSQASAPNPDADTATTPLTVALEGLKFTLKSIYSGDVNGQVTLLGTALAPQVTGRIVLSNGRVLLPSGTTPVVATAPEPGTTSLTEPPRLTDLQLVLGDGVLITRQPILNFVATGELLINGTLDNLRPAGTINLRSGQVNLFTTQFNLARGYQSQAVFQPDRGLDPIINVQLSTSVVEVTRTPTAFQTASPYATSEVADTPVTDFGSFQTIRVFATVNGPASELFENLDLSSSPQRSQGEIVALLGGSFVNTLGQGDGTLAIANLAGSALLSNVQNFVSNALGLSELRLFPTTITDRDKRSSTFGIAAELGVNLTNDISISALQLLTAQVPTQFNLRYRLNDEFLLRSSTNLSGDNRAVLEFETRF